MRRLLSILSFLLILLPLHAQKAGVFASAGTTTSSLIAKTIAFYTLDEPSGTLVDSKGSYNSTACTGTYGATGENGSAVSFNGSQKITLPDMAELSISSSSTIAISMDIYITSGTPVGHLSHLFGDWDECSFYMMYKGSNLWDMNFYTSSADVGLPDLVMLVNTWYHLIFVKNGTTLSLYQNNTLVGTATDATYSTINPTKCTIGGEGSDGFYGRIDNVGFFNATLTTQEISDLNTKTYPF